ncbi:MAG: CtsR family transcriptional regulator [Bacillota bacterium]
MRSIADQIEAYLIKLLKLSGGSVIEVQRSEIAQIFACAPSQINYVLTTRFGPEQGYLIESRRGGGGYLRITRVEMSDNELLEGLLDFLEETLVPFHGGERLLIRLLEEGFLTKREVLLMKAVIGQQALGNALPHPDLVRANILKAMLQTFLRDEFK